MNLKCIEIIIYKHYFNFIFAFNFFEYLMILNWVNWPNFYLIFHLIQLIFFSFNWKILSIHLCLLYIKRSFLCWIIIILIQIEIFSEIVISDAAFSSISLDEIIYNIFMNDNLIINIDIHAWLLFSKLKNDIYFIINY